MNKKMIMFLDVLGRTIFAEFSYENEEFIVVKNPAILNLMNNDGRISVQILPLVFREFLASKDETVTFNFRKNGITRTDIENFDYRLTGQYNQIFSGNSVYITKENSPEPEVQSAPEDKKIINLFDED